MTKKLFFLTTFFAACSTWDIHAAAAAAAATQSRAELSEHSGLFCQELINQLETDTFQNNPEDETFALRIIYTEMREDYKRFQQINSTLQQKLTWADFIEKQTNAGKALELLIQKGFITTPAQLTYALNALYYEVSAGLGSPIAPSKAIPSAKNDAKSQQIYTYIKKEYPIHGDTGDPSLNLPPRFTWFVESELIPLSDLLIKLHKTEPASELNQQIAKILWFIHYGAKYSDITTFVVVGTQFTGDTQRFATQTHLLKILDKLINNRLIIQSDLIEILKTLKICGNELQTISPRYIEWKAIVTRYFDEIKIILDSLIKNDLISKKNIDTILEFIKKDITDDNQVDTYTINLITLFIEKKIITSDQQIAPVLDVMAQVAQRNKGSQVHSYILDLLKVLLENNLIEKNQLDNILLLMFNESVIISPSHCHKEVFDLILMIIDKNLISSPEQATLIFCLLEAYFRPLLPLRSSKLSKSFLEMPFDQYLKLLIDLIEKYITNQDFIFSKNLDLSYYTLISRPSWSLVSILKICAQDRKPTESKQLLSQLSEPLVLKFLDLLVSKRFFNESLNRYPKGSDAYNNFKNDIQDSVKLTLECLKYSISNPKAQEIVLKLAQEPLSQELRHAMIQLLQDCQSTTDSSKILQQVQQILIPKISPVTAPSKATTSSTTSGLPPTSPKSIKQPSPDISRPTQPSPKQIEKIIEILKTAKEASGQESRPDLTTKVVKMIDILHRINSAQS